MNTRLQTAAGALETWMRRQALPFWTTTGFNADTGLSYERLTADAAPDVDADLRVRVQARQLFVFSLAEELGWHPRAGVTARTIVDTLRRSARHPDGGYVHLLNKRLEVVDASRDLYDHAFLLLALVWCYRVLGLDAALEEAEGIVEYLDAQLASQHGGWCEGDYPAGHRRQNPHMHLFEAFLAAYDATGERRWLDRADAIFALFEKYFYAPAGRVLLEYFNDDWSVAAGENGAVVEPGHMMEWVWLLRCYEDRTGRPAGRYADALYRRGLQIGLEPGSGLLYDQVRADGSLISATKRCWPMTELIKAGIARARAGDETGEERAAAAIESLMRYYTDTAVPGTYIDQRGPDNEVTVDITPASTLYHLAVAAAEAAAYCKGSREVSK